MNAQLLPRKILSMDWNTSAGKVFDWDRAQAVAINFRNLHETRPSSTGVAASKFNAGNETDVVVNPANSSILRILMVEDSQDDCEIICFRLKKCGYTPRVERVFCEKTMRAALEQGRWDIVITDHGLPGFSGLEAIALLRKMGLQIPVLCITGSVDPVIIRQVLAAGVRACVSKDDLSLLCMSVEHAMNGRPT